MFSSNRLKSVFLTVALFASACGFWHGKQDANASTNTQTVGEPISQIPFATREPSVYTAEIVVTTNGAEDKTFAARDAENRLLIFNYQTEKEIGYLQRAANQTFIFAANKKICAEAGQQSDETKVDEFFTAEWLNEKTDATFERLKPENNLARYRVVFANGNNSEIVVYFDETIKLPVRQEFYNVIDGQRTLILTAEIRNFSESADAKLFELPKDCRKISAKDFYEQAARRFDK